VPSRHSREEKAPRTQFGCSLLYSIAFPVPRATDNIGDRRKRRLKEVLRSGAPVVGLACLPGQGRRRGAEAPG
jgi:hypothetical protein